MKHLLSSVIGLFLLITVLLPVGYASLPIAYQGEVFIDGEKAPEGTIVSAYINGELFDETTLPTLAHGKENFFKLNVMGQDGADVVLQVNGIDVVTTQWKEEYGGDILVYTLNGTKKELGSTCENGVECSSGVCCKNICTMQCRTTSSGGGGGGGSKCTPEWECTSWDPFLCPESGYRNRVCTDVNNCGLTGSKPEEEELCVYTPNCFDGVQNADETGVDCGGDCFACETNGSSSQGDGLGRSDRNLNITEDTDSTTMDDNGNSGEDLAALTGRVTFPQTALGTAGELVGYLLIIAILAAAGWYTIERISKKNAKKARGEKRTHHKHKSKKKKTYYRPKNGS